MKVIPMFNELMLIIMKYGPYNKLFKKTSLHEENSGNDLIKVILTDSFLYIGSLKVKARQCVH